ncbi:MAG: Ig-like domain-containing protein, partial [Paenisporosarcina sp.]|nr:Ig-like domain-containing protein [Paenisporosarcina sp.]
FKDYTSAAYVSWTNGLAIPASPKKIGAWVYGDGANHWLRAAITDAAGKETALDFTADGGLNWVGWKYVEANVPSTLIAPIRLSKIYVAEPSSTKKGKGSIWIDSIQAVYSNQSTPLKSFNPSTSARVVDTNKQFTVTFNQAMNPAYFNTKHVYVEDEYGIRQNVIVQSGTNATKLVVSAPTGGYAIGKSYRLVVTHFAPNASNIRMLKDSITEFKVQ